MHYFRAYYFRISCNEQYKNNIRLMPAKPRSWLLCCNFLTRSNWTMLHMCTHTLSLADMCHTMRCPAALVLVLGETAEEAKMQGENGLSTLWRAHTMEEGVHGQRFVGMNTTCAKFACLMMAGSACWWLWRKKFLHRKCAFEDIQSLTAVEHEAIGL